MRISSYLSGAPVPASHQHVILHGLKGALSFIDSDLGERVLSARGQAMDPAQFSAAEAERLGEAGLLTPLDEGEERGQIVALAGALRGHAFTQAPTSFMIVPTLTCNLRCPYCFQSHEMHKGKGVFSTLMSEAQIDEIFAIIDRLGAPGAMRAEALGLPLPLPLPRGGARGSRLTLFGGEPLCAATLPAIPAIVARAQARAMTLSAITNGVELDLFEDHVRPGVIEHLQITLDGLAEKHDRRRIGPAHKATFDRIVANVDRVLDRGVAVSMRINVDTANLLDIGELNDFFRARGWYRFAHFEPYAAAVDDMAPRRAAHQVTHLDVLRETERLREEAESRIASYEGVAGELVGSILTRPDDFALMRGSTCSAETGQMIFDPLGHVYACWEDVGDARLKIATFADGDLRFDPEAVSAWFGRFPGPVAQCARCPYALVHTSGCGAHARAVSGELHSAACEGFQQLFPEALGRAVRRFVDALPDDVLPDDVMPTDTRPVDIRPAVAAE